MKNLLIIDSFTQLKEVNFRDTDLSEESLDYVCNNLSETIEKLGLGGQGNLRDKHISAFAKKCKKLKSLDLSHFVDEIGNLSLTNIIECLKFSLEELDISCRNIDNADFTEIQSMSRLKLLIYSDFEDVFFLQGLLPNLNLSILWLGGRILGDILVLNN